MKTSLLALGATLLVASPTFASDDKDNKGTPSVNPTSITYQVLNSQTNSGTVTSTINYAATVPASAVLNGSSIVLNNNSVHSQAFGNITQNVINSIIPVGVTNNQTNSGSVTSTVTNARIGPDLVGTLTNSSISVTGNSITAVAVGNSSSTILGH